MIKALRKSLQADAFRGHGFSLLVAALLRGLQLMLFPLESPPFALSSKIHMEIYEDGFYPLLSSSAFQ
jgi:hypothetical protein